MTYNREDLTNKLHWKNEHESIESYKSEVVNSCLIKKRTSV